MVTSGDYVTLRVNGIKYFEKPPFFYWMQIVSYHAFGLNEWAVRLPNALMGLLDQVSRISLVARLI
jgi:4-amino-4-deoxy-L-arabinose transferase-like glycosyltransferase